MTMSSSNPLDEEEVPEYRQQMSQAIAEAFISEDSGLEVDEAEVTIDEGKISTGN